MSRTYNYSYSDLKSVTFIVNINEEVVAESAGWAEASKVFALSSKFLSIVSLVATHPILRRSTKWTAMVYGVFSRAAGRVAKVKSFRVKLDKIPPGKRPDPRGCLTIKCYLVANLYGHNVDFYVPKDGCTTLVQEIFLEDEKVVVEY